MKRWISPLNAASLLVGVGLFCAALQLSEGSTEGPLVDGEPAAAEAEQPRSGELASRILAMAQTNPHLDYAEMERLSRESDAMRDRYEATERLDLGHFMRQRLRDAVIDEAEARAWFEAHRATFGSRSFEASRITVERLIAIDLVRDELALD